MTRRQLRFVWSCSDHAPHEHRSHIAAWLCGRLQRMRALLGADPHYWRAYQRRVGSTVFVCRNCKCGVDQVKAAGPRGDGKWRSVAAPDAFGHGWERRQFESATVELL